MDTRNESSTPTKGWNLVNFCEFDQYATKSYCAIHNVDESLNLGDINEVDENNLEPFNMICGGSPCQDFSVAGEQKGSVWSCKDCVDEEGKPFRYNPLTVHWSKRDKCPHCGSENIEKTRSSLLVEYLRIIRGNKPNFGMYENVKNIVGKKFKETTFKLFEEELHEYGYNTYWKVLNAKDYGVPQNRERVYLIFIKKELDNGKFVFPEGFDNGIRLRDVLEEEVDEKYFISEERMNIIRNNLGNVFDNNFIIGSSQKKAFIGDDTLSPSLTSAMGNGGGQTPMVKQVGNIVNTGNWDNPQRGRIYSPDGCSPALNCCGGGGGLEPKIVQVGNVNPSGKGMNGNVFSDEGLAPTLTTNKGEGNKILSNLRIRKLTPKECFRLMGFDDSAYEAASKLVSNSQMYKQTGNSIVVDVLYYILVELYKAMPYLFDDLRLSSFFSGIGAFEISLDRLYEGINTGNFTHPQVD